MASVMATHFRPYGWICRAVGLFFLQGLQSRRVHDVRATWKTWYTLYSLACLFCFASGDLAVVLANLIRVSLRVRSFTKSMLLVLVAVMAVRVTVNVATALFGSPGMVEFFKKSAEYEKRTAFSREHHRARSWLSYLFRFFFLVAFFAHIVINATLSVRVFDFKGNRYLEFGVKAGVLLLNLFCFVYDVLHFVELRPCCEVLVSYIRHQGDLLRASLATREFSGADDNRPLECVRINLRSIIELKKVLNDVWQYSIVTSAVAILTITCFTVYSLFDGGIRPDQLAMIVTYCFYSAVDFADVARLSQTMSNEVRRLKEYLAKMSMLHESPARCAQLAGSVITYSVILVQTSDSVDQRTLPRSKHTGAL
ncbi:hypothetical protein HPB50_008402 [Hyalomma asiaticum]|uniref:Uncharacterized protein n=1 Tax=Hyalomma asiaticum TaxID=266040 RepID=A0ACB7RN03_HYAAI|nr:hypothetical protein HPB50_008402 [Hyalomma asiaticum]